MKHMSMDSFQVAHVSTRLAHHAPPLVVESISLLLREEDWLRPSAAEFLELRWFTDELPPL